MSKVTHFRKGTRIIPLKYQRKMSRSEVEKMRSFKAEDANIKLVKKPNFEIKDVEDDGDIRIYTVRGIKIQ